jgi:hypothetical protein
MRKTNNEWAGRNSGDVRKEIENRELQELEEDPFRIERDPRKEQEEYFRPIRQEWIDPGSSEENGT